MLPLHRSDMLYERACSYDDAIHQTWVAKETLINSGSVIPAKAGIQKNQKARPRLSPG